MRLLACFQRTYAFEEETHRMHLKNARIDNKDTIEIEINIAQLSKKFRSYGYAYADIALSTIVASDAGRWSY